MPCPKFPIVPWLLNLNIRDRTYEMDYFVHHFANTVHNVADRGRDESRPY